MSEQREIGSEAVWSLSSAKPGNGVEQLRDGSTETFWQSDGPQPHLVNIQFMKKVRVSTIRIFTNFKVDESYTPSCISVRIGTSESDLQEIQVVDLKEPEGWMSIKLAQSSEDPSLENQACTPRDPEMGGAVDFVRTHMVQIAIIANHQNGRDTHVRQIQVFGPRSAEMQLPRQVPSLRAQTPALQQFATIR
mmetsp:Transcript_57721/g.122797  ORF Transcript_57721/g.122797 Transcript_57721/m.122797 type:complete len:192 (-) Transcript_57721:227-802(-)|eukprot:CAMPEP_0206488870 /NCGR_PEP_ID=MMETSP0324_2-20121206/42731_1 /ASSEMBLY_ACC=CAM_ASM_000836 /TAXON_ID=2866 /ORGANISM="Crypthecodinium cohnii, Strain Seligo" /LENGTH=191 /DNA_ID=CAMNT_0053968099 /DNA_START=80 /DNA_END=655 /DNA_ORIENTATION=-